MPVLPEFILWRQRYKLVPRYNNLNLLDTPYTSKRVLHGVQKYLHFVSLSLYTAIRPHGHSRQARASSVSSRQKKEGIIVQRFKVK